MQFEWRTAALSVRGASHEAEGRECQDAFASLAGSGFAVAAVADGLSSAPHSGEGARLAVERAVDSAWGELTSGEANRCSSGVLALTALMNARRYVLESAGRIGGDPQSFASTLLVVVVTERDAGYAQIGDGAIVVRRRDGDYERIPRPESEFVNLVVPLTSHKCEETMTFGDLEVPPPFFVLFTDGLEPAVIEGGKPYSSFFAGLEQNLLKADESGAIARFYGEYFRGETFRKRYSEDDVTFVAMLRTCANLESIGMGLRGE